MGLNFGKNFTTEWRKKVMRQKKRIFAGLFCAVIALTVSLTACGQSGSLSEGGSSSSSEESGSVSAASTSQAQSLSSPTSKILVAYFSHTGNTRTIANQIHDQAGGDVFEIVPVNPYPSDYNAVVNQARKELDSDYRPELKTKAENMEAYDVIFVGSPCWWGTIAPPVKTFLSQYDFSGKTIIPFDTHEGSGLGNCAQDIKKLCPNANVVMDGLAVRGSDVNNAKNTVSDWLKKVGIAQ
jgi:Flavodoxins